MLRTLGGLQLEGSSFQQPKPLLLLTYLALEGPRERRHLQTLFWGGAADAANSLRVALRRLRLRVPGAALLDGARVGTTLATDAQRLMQAAAAAAHEEVVALYGGRFLEGLELPDWGPELEEWVYRTREILATLTRSALLHLAEHAAARGEAPLAARRAEAAYLLPGAPEPEAEDLRRLHALLPGEGALAAEVRREAGRSGLILTAPASTPALGRPGGELPTNLPAQGTSFVGRDAELRRIREILTESPCRLLSVVGPGGVGKTRLAVQACLALLDERAFPGGLCFVNLAAVGDSVALASALAAALAVKLDGREDALAQLARHLAPRAALLVLDNFESWLQGVPLLLELLSHCPQLRLLVTSRENLNVREEWCLPLDGLPFGTDAAQAGEPPSVQLFAQRAQRNGLSFSLNADTSPDVLELCQLVYGSPLAIELAAAWTRVLPVREIVRELRRNLDFLTDVNGRNPERHASLRAVFEQSWSLLGAREQRALARLSVFRGGFRHEAAAEVADVSLPLLASLTDKSLLKAGPDGRFGRHPLLYQYTQEKLAAWPAEEAQARRAHAEHFLRLLSEQRPRLQGPRAADTLRELEPHLENIRVAWGWAMEQADGAALSAAGRALRLFYDRTGRYHEGIEAFAAARAALAGTAAPGPLGELCIHQAQLSARISRFAEVRTLTERGLALLRQGEHHATAWIEALDLLGTLERHSGHFATAHAHWREALQLAQAAGDRVMGQRLWTHLGIAEEALGRYDEAQRCYEAALELGGALGDAAGTLSALINFGTLFIRTRQFERAQGVLLQALDLARNLHSANDTAHVLNNLAVAVSASGDLDAARAYGEEALDLARRVGKASLEAGVLETLARIELEGRQVDAALGRFTDCLKLAWTLGYWPVILQALEGIAEVHAERREFAQARELLKTVLQHDSATDDLRAQVRQRLQGLEDVSEPVATPSQESLDGLVTRLLTALRFRFLAP